MSLQYPIAVDSSHAIWNAFRNTENLGGVGLASRAGIFTRYSGAISF
jgi:hypothetical protein